MQPSELAHPGSQPAPEGYVRPDDDARGKQGPPLQLEFGIQVWAHHVLDLLWELNEQGVCLCGGALSAPPRPVTGGFFCCAIVLQYLLGSIPNSHCQKAGVKTPLSKRLCQKAIVKKPLSKSSCQAHTQACAEHTSCCRLCQATCLNSFARPVGCRLQVLYT